MINKYNGYAFTLFKTILEQIMIKKTLILFFLIFFCNYNILASDTNISELEKRVIYLEKQVKELKRNSINDSLGSKWLNLKSGVNKINIKNDLGDPDRIGKYSNGDEIWGFKNFTLRFDKNGKLKNWSKPFLK
tara:strand:+ start:1037 stop:1435 length:399 start_codon:yes stop_codon:yes gene_type:complete